MLNKVILMGRLTRDPEVRVAPTNNLTVCSFSLAVDRGYTKPGEERKADFINITAFGKTGEFCKNYFKKGQLVAVTGRIQTRSWDDAEGKKHYATDVIVEEAHFAESKKQDNSADTLFNNQENTNDGFLPINSDDELPF